MNEEAANARSLTVCTITLLVVYVCYLQRLPHMVVACQGGRRMWLVAGLQRVPLLTGHPEHHTSSARQMFAVAERKKEEVDDTLRNKVYIRTQEDTYTQTCTCAHKHTV